MPTLNSIVRQVLAIDPSAPAIEYQKQWHSWGDLSAIIDAIEGILRANGIGAELKVDGSDDLLRSEEHTSELQSLMRISYAVFCLKQKSDRIICTNTINSITTIKRIQTR